MNPPGSCKDICKTCEDKEKCSKCKGENRIVGADETCTCRDGFYDKDFSFKDSKVYDCIKCPENMKTCKKTKTGVIPIICKENREK